MLFAFFPWLQIDHPIRIGKFHLLPYIPKETTQFLNSQECEAVNSIVDRYFEYGDRSIKRFTILQIGSKVIRNRVSSSQLIEAFNFSELLSFSAIACNELFCQVGSYTNRDQFQLVFQHFRIPVQGITVENPRKDGKTTSFVDIQSFRIQKPSNIHTNFGVDVDELLLSALYSLTQANSEMSLRLIESIFLFNWACTDNPHIPEHFELISMYSAIEKLCDLPSSGNITPQFSKHYSPKPRIFTTTVTNHRLTVSNAWINELKILRGSVAHGHINSYLKLKWSIREHLLLGSVIFPILVKNILSREGLYKFSDQDHVIFNSFEKLAISKPLTRRSGMKKWLDTLSKVTWKIATEKVVRKLNEI